MSVKKISKEQPTNFEFNSENILGAKKIIKNYPKGKQQSAVMALLFIAQRQNNNWIPLAAMKYIAKLLEMPYIKVYEVATFYSMYNLSPVGNYFIQICTTTPCMIRGAYKLVEACKEKISDKEKARRLLQASSLKVSSTIGTVWEPRETPTLASSSFEEE